MHLILLGPPGVGKGTHAKTLIQQLHLTHLSSGDMLRTAVMEHGSLGSKVQALMSAGQLVPDELIIDLIKARMTQEDCRLGCLLDGFPRTLAQANALTQSGIMIDQVLILTAPDGSLITRLSGRRVHLPSGRIYHTLHQPPIVTDRDDFTGDPLTKRADDEEHIIRERLLAYHQQTAPLISYYRQQAQQGRCRYAEVDADRPVAEVSAALRQQLVVTHHASGELSDGKDSTTGV